jgi:hypothetical protein
VQPTSTLLVGTRRVGIVADQGYYEPGAPPVLRGTLSTELGKVTAELGIPEKFLGVHPIIVGGEEHHEKHIQLTPAPREVDLHGHLIRVVSLPIGVDVWQFEERLRAQLAVVDEAGKVTVLPDHELVGPPLADPSPVLAKQCAAPQIADLIVNGDAAIALLTECNPDAPVRLVTYRWPGPAPTVERLGSTKELGWKPDHLVASGDRRALVGAAHGKLVIHRLGATRRDDLLAGVTRVIEAVMTDDGAVWTLTIAGDDWQVARDGVVVPLADSSGTAMKPAQLGFDSRHGVVVLARHPAAVWLFSER